MLPFLKLDLKKYNDWITLSEHMPLVLAIDKNEKMKKISQTRAIGSVSFEMIESEFMNKLDIIK